MRIALSEHLMPGLNGERLTLARELGANGMELLFGPYAPEQHLLWRAGGPAELRQRAAAAGLALPSVLAAYFNEHPLGDPDASARHRYALVLERLLDACSEAGVSMVVLPLLGPAELRQEAASNWLVDVLAPLGLKAAARGVSLALEMTLPLRHLQALRTALPGVNVGIAYDLGLAAALGADPIVDIKLLGDALVQVRARDVTADGRRAPLGQGVVPWQAVTRLLQGHGFAGWWLLEASRGEAPREAVRADLAFLRSH